MIITSSNILLGVAPTVTTGASTDLPANLTDPDFSTIYRSSDSSRLTYSFGPTGQINYIAVAGINIGSGTFNTISEYARARVFDGGQLIKTVNTIRDNCLVIYFPARSFSNLTIGLKSSNGENPICSFTAAGVAFEVPNGGEVAGYVRQYLSRNIKQKTTTNTIAAPVAVLKKRMPAKLTLNLPNMTKEFSEGTWQDFLDFAVDNFFFIQEQQNNPASDFEDLNPSSYMCYNLMNNKASAHAQTRKLNNLSVSFSVYNGL